MSTTSQNTGRAGKRTNANAKHRIDGADQVSFARAAWPVWRSTGLTR